MGEKGHWNPYGYSQKTALLWLEGSKPVESRVYC